MLKQLSTLIDAEWAYECYRLDIPIASNTPVIDMLRARDELSKVDPVSPALPMWDQDIDRGQIETWLKDAKFEGVEDGRVCKTIPDVPLPTNDNIVYVITGYRELPQYVSEMIVEAYWRGHSES